MTDGESLTLFKEADPDLYVLTAEESVALGAAWRVLEGFERNQYGQAKYYDDDSKDSTLEYLLNGGEERPYSGIFAVQLRESFDAADKIDLFVSNLNGRGNEKYRTILRAVVKTVGIQQP